MSVTTEPLARRLSVIGLWLLAINGMIGAGIFGLPAAVALSAGDFGPWLFLICALLIAPILLCFGELASAFSGTGGPVLYVGSAFGPYAGFQAGWAFYIARLTAFAANLSLMVTSIGYFWPAASGGHTHTLLLALLCAGMVWTNVAGARTAMASLGALTALKMLPLLALAMIGMIQFDEALPAALTPPDDLGAACLLAMYAFVGFESSVVPAGEARHPQRDLPRALLAALFVCALLYGLVQLAASHLLPALASSERPLIDVGDAWLGQPGALFMAFGIVASVGANLVGSMFSTPRVSYRLALDRQLPQWFGVVHRVYGTPSNSILFYGLAAFALAASGSFVWLAVMSVLTRLLLYLGCIAAMPAVRRRNSPQFHLRGGLLVPMIASAICLALLWQVQWRAYLATAALLAVGTLLYALAARNRVDTLPPRA